MNGKCSIKEKLAEIRAIGTEWDMDRIHQDTMKMAECLKKCSSNP